jgi:hypothetical protein
MITAIVLLSAEADTKLGQRDFTALGFQTTIAANSTLLIAGEQSLFGIRFKLEIQVDEEGAHAMIKKSPSRILPVSALPETMQSYVEAIEFEKPIDFGPVDY